MRKALLFLFALVLVAAACGDDGSATTPAPADAAGFPVIVGGVEIPVRPERIVSLSASHTEILYAVGAGDQVIATDLFSDFPAEALEVEKVDAFNLNVEAVADLDPDLVILAFDPGDAVDGLAALGIPAVLFDAPATLDDAYAQMETVGAATGHRSGADDLVASMRSEITELLAVVPVSPEPLSYYHELGPDLFTVTSDTFIGQIYGALGMVSIADAAGGDPFVQLSAEFIIDADPEVVFLADTKCCGESTSTLAARPGWETMQAVTAGGVVELDDDVASRWGPRLVDFFETIAREVYGVELPS